MADSKIKLTTMHWLVPTKFLTFRRVWAVSTRLAGMSEPNSSLSFLSSNWSKKKGEHAQFCTGTIWTTMVANRRRIRKKHTYGPWAFLSSSNYTVSTNAVSTYVILVVFFSLVEKLELTKVCVAPFSQRTKMHGSYFHNRQALERRKQ